MLADLDKQVKDLFKEIMLHCKLERKSKTDTSIRNLSKRLGKTENFITSVENGREFPSIRTFLKYLLLNDFEVAPLTRLAIASQTKSSKEDKARSSLIKKIYGLNNDQVEFLVEQSKVSEVFNLKSTKLGKKKK